MTRDEAKSLIAPICDHFCISSDEVVSIHVSVEFGFSVVTAYGDQRVSYTEKVR